MVGRWGGRELLGDQRKMGEYDEGCLEGRELRGMFGGEGIGRLGRGLFVHNSGLQGNSVRRGVRCGGGWGLDDIMFGVVKGGEGRSRKTWVGGDRGFRREIQRFRKS